MLRLDQVRVELTLLQHPVSELELVNALAMGLRSPDYAYEKKYLLGMETPFTDFDKACAHLRRTAKNTSVSDVTAAFLGIHAPAKPPSSARPASTDTAPVLTLKTLQLWWPPQWKGPWQPGLGKPTTTKDLATTQEARRPSVAITSVATALEVTIAVTFTLTSGCATTVLSQGTTHETV